MLKTNNQLLEEKIAYIDAKIARYTQKVEAISELILCNRAILNNLLSKRKHTKIVFDVENNQAKEYKNKSTQISSQEKVLSQENVALASEMEKLENKIAELNKTKVNFQSILSGTKTKTKLVRTK